MLTIEIPSLLRLPIATPEGEFMAYYSPAGLAALDFPGQKAASVVSLELAALPAPVRAWHRVTVAAVKAALAGRVPAALPPLDVTGGTEFQQQVWRALRKIKPGHTRSYGEIAESIGNAKAVRAVGGACGANPIPLLVPCHRVLAAHGKIDGYSGGLGWKEKLLAREGVALAQ